MSITPCYLYYLQDQLIINILGNNESKKNLRMYIFVFLAIFVQIRTKLNQFKVGTFFKKTFLSFLEPLLN